MYARGAASQRRRGNLRICIQYEAIGSAACCTRAYLAWAGGTGCELDRNSQPSTIEGMASSTRGLGGRFWALVLATFLGFLGIGTVLPMLAPHVRYVLHGSDRDVGFVVGIFSFVALAGRLIAGPLADRRGRKITFLTGLFCCGLAGGAYFLPKIGRAS